MTQVGGWSPHPHRQQRKASRRSHSAAESVGDRYALMPVYVQSVQLKSSAEVFFHAKYL